MRQLAWLLAWSASFRRAFKRRTKNNQILRERAFEILELLVENPYNPLLKTHKLYGQLEGFRLARLNTTSE